MLDPKTSFNAVPVYEGEKIVKVCLVTQAVPFAELLFILESNLFSFNLSTDGEFLVRLVPVGAPDAYLHHEIGTACFTLTQSKEEASTWKKVSDNYWLVTTKKGTTENTTGLAVSFFDYVPCSNCTEGKSCNFFTGECVNCLNCYGTCRGKCPTGFKCKLVQGRYECQEKNQKLRTVLNWIIVLVVIAVFVLVIVFLTR